MKLSAAIIVFLLALQLFSGAQALRTFSGDLISIDTPINDDVFAAGSVVNINAPVNSAVVAGGTVNVNAPVKGDLIAGGGQVNINSDVGGKVVAAGGNIDQGGNVGTNLVALGGQVSILPQSIVSKDALIVGGNVVNAGRVNGTLTVSANGFQNTGSAGKVDFQKMETPKQEKREAWGGLGLFGLALIMGYLILGLILLRVFPGLFVVVNEEIMRSPAVVTAVGFVSIIAAFIALIVIAATIVGLPIAIIGFMLTAIALMLTGTFVSFAIGKWIGSRFNLKYGDMILFLIGFAILNVLFLIPFLGGLIYLISASLGFGAVLYSAKNQMRALPKHP
ncbi:MAG: hypothetical protein NTW84_02045 [Methanothrix sp.]|nr:hypothetical protein [Methanothrix sp.]